MGSPISGSGFGMLWLSQLQLVTPQAEPSTLENTEVRTKPDFQENNRNPKPHDIITSSSYKVAWHCIKVQIVFHVSFLTLNRQRHIYSYTICFKELIRDCILCSVFSDSCRLKFQNKKMRKCTNILKIVLGALVMCPNFIFHWSWNYVNNLSLGRQRREAIYPTVVRDYSWLCSQGHFWQCLEDRTGCCGFNSGKQVITLSPTIFFLCPE